MKTIGIVLSLIALVASLSGCYWSLPRFLTASTTADIISKDPRAKEEYRYLYAVLKRHPVPEISRDLYGRVLSGRVLVLPDASEAADGVTPHILIGDSGVPAIGFVEFMVAPTSRSANLQGLQVAMIHEYVLLRQFDRTKAVFHPLLSPAELRQELWRRREENEREAYGATCLMGRRLNLKEETYRSCARGGTMEENYQYAAKYFAL